MVHFPGPGADPVVGHSANRVRVLKPAETVYSVKRFIGRRGGEISHEEMLVTYPVRGEGAGPVTVNILQATHRAMDRALAQLDPPPEHVLVDGRRVQSLRFPQTALVKGDARSFSIAAASVLAKVTRDRLMLEYDRQFPAYGFARHKGYGTAGHLAALAKHGPCPIHRRSFAPLKRAEPQLFEFQ